MRRDVADPAHLGESRQRGDQRGIKLPGVFRVGLEIVLQGLEGRFGFRCADGCCAELAELGAQNAALQTGLDASGGELDDGRVAQVVLTGVDVAEPVAQACVGAGLRAGGLGRCGAACQVGGGEQRSEGFAALVRVAGGEKLVVQPGLVGIEIVVGLKTLQGRKIGALGRRVLGRLE